MFLRVYFWNTFKKDATVWCFFFRGMRRLINKINEIASTDQRDNNGLTKRQKKDRRDGFSDACSLRMTCVEPWQDRKLGMRSDKDLINHSFLLWGHIQTQSNTLTQTHYITMHHCDVCIIRRIGWAVTWRRYWSEIGTMRKSILKGLETRFNKPAYRNMYNKYRSIDKV